MAEKIFDQYTLDDYKTFFSVASSVVIQNLFVGTQELTHPEREIIDDNLRLIYRALRACRSQFGFRLKEKTHFPFGSLGDAFERVMDACFYLKIPSVCQTKKVFGKPQNLKVQLKKERLRQKRNNYLKKGLRRVLTILTHTSKKEK